MRSFAALALALLPLFAQAQPQPLTLSPDEARAVRVVIEAQLDAFRRDDSARAFSYAAPGIRATFGTPENFMEMVRTQYAVVYRPSSVAFEEPIVADGQVVQPVRLTDAEGRAWLALYPMLREADGTWRINGCYLRRASGQQS
jgi:hypothetical protein